MFAEGGEGVEEFVPVFLEMRYIALAVRGNVTTQYHARSSVCFLTGKTDWDPNRRLEHMRDFFFYVRTFISFPRRLETVRPRSGARIETPATVAFEIRYKR